MSEHEILGEQRARLFVESDVHENQFFGCGVTTSRKRGGRATQGLRLIGAKWRMQPPANGNRDEREPRTQSLAEADHAGCDDSGCRTCHDTDDVLGRRHKERQMWLRGRELCAAAALYRATGRLRIAADAIDRSCAILRSRTILRRRRGIFESELGNN